MYSRGKIAAVFDGDVQIGLLLNWECTFQKFSFEVNVKSYWFEKQPEESKEYTIHLYLDSSKSRRRYEGCVFILEEVEVSNEIINKPLELIGRGQLEYREE
ncbi:hypothetical protein [Alkaliphilus peptidifermentans]|uniref:Uncharacterized protein n=1 Tax=Alkaliphilus peptidifermentans DSM 18978 TaxID=1120976 RepID=A0A1G5EDQ8_9FIRM|nr:hypothetical protein [Alkaliphilus peptidifermentans]SCY25143.1 hypothetical protein SAMN03080606_01129 [Alkaliphilus peptidifermentans DSM 18978]